MKKMYIILFFVIILLIIFAFCYYNTSIFGNNIVIKNENKIVDYVLNNINEYEAEIEVTVKSNKTTNIYKMKQNVSKNYSSIEVLSKGKINGLKIEMKDRNLKIQNTELKLDKIYENYEPLTNNTLFLNTFIKKFKESNSTTYMKENNIVFEVPNFGKLYVDMQTSKPIKLEIKDNTKKTNICINYISIEIK
ncbi:MAG: hypothetical protein OSJ66_02060 [Clostridia bacterium]|nr:hypothetical protein [Clostridia bacterium]